MLSIAFAYVVALVASIAVGAGILTYALRHRDAVGAVPLCVLIAGQSIWAACTLGSVVTGGATAIGFAKLSFLGVGLNIAGLLVFALEFTGNDGYLGPRLYGLLSVEPVLALFAVWWNPNGLFWSSVERATGELAGPEVVHGPLFWTHAAYSYVLLGVATLLLVQFALRSETLYRQQVYGVLVGVFVPWIVNVVYLYQPIPFDPTPVAFSVVGAGLYWSVFSGDFLDISPVAHSAMVDSINSGVYVVDRKDRLVELNEQGRRILGVDEDEDVVGRPVTELLGDDPTVIERYRELSTADEEFSVELQADDRYFDVQVTPLYNDRERLVGKVFLVYDVTRRTEREHELERRNRELNWFASVVSHDLRNPLNVASGTLDLARETGDEEHFDVVDQSLDRMEQLIQEVLTLAEGGEAETETVRLDRVAERAWEHVATGDAALHVETDRRLLANREQLLQLFENLYRNSIEHGTESPGAEPATTDGAPPVTVTVGDVPAGFYVADDGPGIPEDERDEIFEHGYSTGTEGSGLGLTIVEHVVSAHGWTIAVTEGDSSGGEPSKARRTLSDRRSDGSERTDGSRSSDDGRSQSSGARFEITGIDDAAPLG